jgi:hypothetical protein
MKMSLMCRQKNSMIEIKLCDDASDNDAKFCFYRKQELS